MHPKARKAREEGRDRSAIAAAGGSAARSPASSFAQLVSEARGRLDELDARGAAALFERALELRHDDVETLDALGEICFSEGDSARALEVFSRAVALRPTEATPAGAARWLYLGELDEGLGAVEKLRRGTALLQQYLEASPAAPDDPERRAASRDLSGAFCSLAELFMTDLCDEEGAELRCDEFAAAAVAADDSNPEAHRVLADVRMCQARPDDALAPVLRSVRLLEECYPPDNDEEDDDAGVGLPGADSDAKDEDDDAMALSAAAAAAPASRSRRKSGGPSVATASAAVAAAAAAGDSSAQASARAALEFAALAKLTQLPPWESRLRLAQIAMELAAYEPAVSVLVRLLEEDDAAMEVWFLLAEAHFHLGDLEVAQDYLGDAQAMVSEAIAVASSRGKKRGGLGAVALRAASGGGAVAELVALGRPELEAQLAKFRDLAAVVDASATAHGASGVAGVPAIGAAGADEDMARGKTA